MPSAKPTPAFIARALEGVAKAGQTAGAVEVKPDGSVVVLIVAKGTGQVLPSPPSLPDGDSDGW